MSKIRVYFDFVCPYCYHAWGSLRKLQEQKDICLEWYGWEIHPEWRNRKAKEKYAGEREREQFAELGKEAGINATTAKWNASSFDALRLLELAREQGKDDAWVDRVYTGAYQEEGDMSDRATLAKWAEEVGLSGAAEVLAGNQYADTLKKHDQHCMEIALEYVPTLEKDGEVIADGVLTYTDIEKALAQ